jgi:hypothetical protein
MTRIGLSFLLLAAGACFAQQWEVGGSAGAGYLPGVGVTSPAGSATTGFKSGAAFGGFLGQNLYPHWSGELHYGFLQSNLKVQSGGTETSFTGVAHVVHYDLVLHTNRRGTRAQAFVAFGGGLKVFRGTGKESAYQPLSQFAILTKTQELKPMASVGGGLRYKLGQRVYLRTEFRDYITPFPKTLIAPGSNAKINSKLLHDFVPMVAISYEF